MRTVVPPEEESLGASKTLIVGAPKVGKTHLAGLWPQPALIDTEKGSGTIPCLRLQINPDAQLLSEVISAMKDISSPPRTQPSS
jgi:hypothetical protein